MIPMTDLRTEAGATILLGLRHLERKKALRRVRKIKIISVLKRLGLWRR